MTELRAAKVAAIVGAPGAGGRLRAGRPAARARLGLQRGRDPRRRPAGAARGPQGGLAHLRHLNPLPGEHRRGDQLFDRVLVPEMNTGQLAQILRARLLVDIEASRRSVASRFSPGRSSSRSWSANERRPTATDTATAAKPTLSKADFQSDQETRWCPGCGDYAVLSAVQQFMPELGIPPERIVFITGIGCAGRFAYYMDTYGMHGIHGRAPALATGWPPPGTTSRSGWSPATGTPCRSAATT